MIRRFLLMLLLLGCALGIGVWFALIAMEDGNDAMSPEQAGPLPVDIITNSTRGGHIAVDETWDGSIFITETVIVDEGVTLSIHPGTVVKFKNNRNYKNPEKLRIEVRGTLKAIGENDDLITFTSDAFRPRNGDWGGIEITGKNGSEIRYAIVEFGMDGVTMRQSDTIISHCIIRWQNHNGITVAEHSSPVIESTRIYQNGRHGVSITDSNGALLRNNAIEKNADGGLHLSAAQAALENSILKENMFAGLWLDHGSALRALNNSIGQSGAMELHCGTGVNTLNATGNKIIRKTVESDCPKETLVQIVAGTGVVESSFEIVDTRKFYLLHTPGDLVRDRYPYAYARSDDTRKVLQKIGKGLGPVSGIAVDGQSVWVATLDGRILKLNSETGEHEQEWKSPVARPTGLAFDGIRLWIADAALRRTVAIDPLTGMELDSFLNPEAFEMRGMAANGTLLLLKEAGSDRVFVTDDQGNVQGSVTLQAKTGDGVAWDGKNIWASCEGGICRFGSDGKLLGKIYATSEATNDLEWEPGDNRYGGYLWVAGETNEHWKDEKIFQVEVTSDSLVRRPVF